MGDWLWAVKCVLWGYSYLFTPQVDITAYELAYICSKRGCTNDVTFDSQKQFDDLPENIKRHFQFNDKLCIKRS